MDIISHRGFWKSKEEKNSLKSFDNAVLNSFGIETDVRDFDNNIVISHDPPGKNSLRFEAVLELFQNNDRRCDPYLALNIKSDGIGENIKENIKKYQINNYFCFDMSIPQLLLYQKLGLKTFTRISDIELKPVLYEQAEGIWLDELQSTWLESSELIEEHISNGKKVCVVSPELHGRRYNKVWDILFPISKEKDLMLCTDYPLKAREYFTND